MQAAANSVALRTAARDHAQPGRDAETAWRRTGRRSGHTLHPLDHRLGVGRSNTDSDRVAQPGRRYGRAVCHAAERRRRCSLGLASMHADSGAACFGPIPRRRPLARTRSPCSTYAARWFPPASAPRSGADYAAPLAYVTSGGQVNGDWDRPAPPTAMCRFHRRTAQNRPRDDSGHPASRPLVPPPPLRPPPHRPRSRAPNTSPISSSAPFPFIIIDNTVDQPLDDHDNHPSHPHKTTSQHSPKPKSL